MASKLDFWRFFTKIVDSSLIIANDGTFEVHNFKNWLGPASYFDPMHFGAFFRILGRFEFSYKFRKLLFWSYFDQNSSKIATFENYMKIQISPKSEKMLQNAWDRSMMQARVSFWSWKAQKYHHSRLSTMNRQNLWNFSENSVLKHFNRAFLELLATNVAGFYRLL